MIEAYPADARILHIGPPKTGTTSLQNAMHAQRAELDALGLVNASRKRHDRIAATWVAYQNERDAPLGPDGENEWRKLAHRITSPVGKRVFFSSEMLSLAGPEQIARIRRDLGDVDLRIVLTMRSIASLIPSRWQQSLYSGMQHTLSEWTDLVFAGSYDFWYRYAIDEAVQRWADGVGADNVTLVMLDPSDRGMLFDAFERLLALPEHTLRAVPDSGENVSLPYPEAEVLRRFVGRYLQHGGDRGFLHRSVARRARRELAEVSKQMPKHTIAIPADAVERANERATAMIPAIEASGIHVVGDLQNLLAPVRRDVDTTVPETLTVDSAAELAWALYSGGRDEAASERPAATQDLSAVPASALAAELRARALKRVRGR